MTPISTPSRDFKALRRLVLVIGACLLALVLLADVVGLSAQGFSRGQVMVALVGFVLMLGGLFGKKLISAYQMTAVLLLNTLVMLVIIEMGAGVLSWLISSDDVEEETPVFNNTYYADKDWAETYWAEFNALEKYDYQPYVGWRRSSFAGETINVDGQRHRITPNATCTPEAYTVFAFGGSTMWGTGAPDWGTIPAYLQTKLDEQLDQPVCVINFGQSAYVSTQNVIELVLRLKSGHIPDLVIFYDGINDVYAAYQNGRADQHQNFYRLQAVFSGENTQPLSEALISSLRDDTYSGTLLNRWFSGLKEDPAPITYATMGVEADALSDEILSEYLGNYGFVVQLAEAYHFEMAFFWQPIIVEGDKVLTPEEQTIRETLDPDLIALYDETYQRVRGLDANDYPKLYDISGALDDQSEGLWIDTFHITPIGNEIIADTMLEILADTLP